jgi:hypothetical protein
MFLSGVHWDDILANRDNGIDSSGITDQNSGITPPTGDNYEFCL